MDNTNNTKSSETGTTLMHRHQTTKALTGLILTQMSTTKGIKVFGQPAIDALSSELRQLHDKGVFVPHHAADLTHEQRKSALRATSLNRKTQVN
jgi:hypothetical protein